MLETIVPDSNAFTAMVVSDPAEDELFKAAVQSSADSTESRVWPLRLDVILTISKTYSSMHPGNQIVN